MRRLRGFNDLLFAMVHKTNNLVERTHYEVVARTVRRVACVEPAKSLVNVVEAGPG